MKLLGILSALTVVLLLPAVAATLVEPPGNPVKDTIEHLIQTVAESKLTFIRNGSEHTSVAAAALMRRKLAAVQAQVHTPEDFIRLAASQSHLSGKPYLVKLGDGSTVPTAEWLAEMLRKYRTTHPAG